MSSNSNKISNFWKEVKRRHVHRTLAIYAGSAFVFLEAATIIFPRWGFPDWTIDLVLYLLILGALITLVVTWIFDITPEGVQKTKPADEVPETDKAKDSNAWKIATYISLTVIIALIILNVVPHDKKVRAGSIESLMVLPFDNFTGLDNFEYYVAGMHSGLIGDLGKISALRVVSRTSSKLFKDAGMSIPEIASESGVDAVIEPSISCFGEDSLCVQIKVIKPFPEEEQIWAQDYRVAKTQILNFFNSVTKNISEEISVVLTPQEESLLAERRIIDDKAVEAYYLGLHYLDKKDRNNLQKASEYFKITIEIEPEWAPPYAGLAAVDASQMQMSFLSPSVAIPKIYENLNKTLELDPNSSNSHYIKAVIAVWTEWNWEKGEQEFKECLELNPSNAECRMFYAHLLMILKRPDEAIHQANLAMKLDPLRPFILGLGGVVIGGTGDEESAIALFEKALSIDSTDRFAIYGLSGVYRQIGDYEKWFEYFKKIGWQDDHALASVDSVFQEQGYRAAVELTIKIDEEAAKEGYVDVDILGYRNLELNNYDKAMDYYEKAYEIHHPNMPYIGGLVKNYEQLRDNPRYITLLKKMNLY